VVAYQLSVKYLKSVCRSFTVALLTSWHIEVVRRFWAPICCLPGILVATVPAQIQFAQPVSYSLQLKLASQGIVPQRAIIAADLNGDGKPDLVVGLANGVAVLLNNGNGTFASPAVYNIASNGGVLAVAAIDLNEDTKLDIVAFTDNPAGLHILLNRGNGSFLPDDPLTLGLRAKTMATGDFNGDGRIDVAVSYNTNSNGCCQSWNQIFSNQGDGTLAFLSTFSAPGNAFDCCGGSALYAVDVNADGLTDIVTNNSDGSFSVLINQGNGDMANPVTYRTNAPVVSNYYFADLNGDGAIDIVMNEELYAFDAAYNQGRGVFSNNLTRVDNGFFLFGTPLAIGDFNNDGSIDIVGLDLSNDLLVFSNDGLGGFGTPVQQQSTLRAVNAGIALADFNGDGKLDFATMATDNNGYAVVEVVFNTTLTQNSTITVAGLTPSQAGNGSISAMRLIGTGFPSGMKVTFTGPGPSLIPTNVSISSDGTLATGTLNLTSAMSGSYSLLLSNGVGTQLVSIPNALTVNSPTGLRFVPATPCRAVDTRLSNGPFGGPYIAGGTSREFDISSGPCGIPSTAKAYSLNVTVVPKGYLAYLIVWPTGEQQPKVSLLNSFDGRVKANAAILAGGNNGGVSVFASNDTDVLLDINGYFVSSADDNSALAFYSMSPCRVIDTRKNVGPLSGPYLYAGQPRSFPILSSSCNVPSLAQAYSLNMTVVPKGYLGYLLTWPTGELQPKVSTLNAFTGTVTANAAIVTAGLGGAFSAYASNDTDFFVDINGYFAPPGIGGLSLYGMTPCRTLDTRLNNGQVFSGTLVVSTTTGPCGLPAAGAYVMNATIIPQGPFGYLTLWPDGQALPLASTLNAFDGAVTSNMAIVPSTNGSIDAYASGPTHLVLDISGYFAP
jgi:hypothetical protein